MGTLLLKIKNVLIIFTKIVYNRRLELKRNQTILKVIGYLIGHKSVHQKVSTG